MDGEVEDALADAVSQLSFAVMGVLTRVAADHELSLTQLRLLGILRDRSPRMAELGARLGLEKSTMSGLVDRGEARGLLIRTRSAEDARATHVALTRAGARLNRSVEADVRSELAPMLRRLSGRDATIAARLLGRLTGAAER